MAITGTRASVLAAGLLAALLLLPAAPVAAEQVITGTGIQVTATAYPNGTTTLEVRELKATQLDGQMQHWSACRGSWMVAPLTGACGPVQHGAARFHQTQSLTLQVGATGTFNTTLGGWTVSCLAAGGAFVCEDTGAPVWDEPLVHTCSAKLPGLGLPGAVGLWDCMAQEE